MSFEACILSAVEQRVITREVGEELTRRFEASRRTHAASMSEGEARLRARRPRG